jgi:hypothetical protein
MHIWRQLLGMLNTSETLPNLTELSELPVVEISSANHFLFYDQLNHYAAARASFARECNWYNP